MSDMSRSYERGARVAIRVAGLGAPIVVGRGANLRRSLIEAGSSPHVFSRRKINCGGLGMCGTCKVLVQKNGEWWEERACQVRVFDAMEIQLKHPRGVRERAEHSE